MKQTGFLRKRHGQQKSVKKGKIKPKNIDIHAEVDKIVKEGRKTFDDYSVVIVAYGMSQVLEDLLSRVGTQNLTAYIKDKKARLDTYLTNVTTAMKKEI